uniref:uncharacterized protein LOC100178994 isoform X1 n=1 Tax=Ciona intestinalis TaxID=7719 RepID=UPI000180CAAD|nr:uncharacterized protein LOC100178994 isoform X1 [Ciona intestinalis]|eukprot:XP_009858030.1 uncharacterized protein LOC100178994 isoform X1 [Ciona intestinalis]
MRMPIGKQAYALRNLRKRKETDKSAAYASKYFKSYDAQDSKPERINETFYDDDCIQTAKSMLGMTLARKLESEILRCKIVEVEAYMSNADKASHSYNFKRTKRNEAMFMKPGTLYVYMTYGMYYCMNISSKGHGDAVLIRGVEPFKGLETMQKNRAKINSKQNQIKNVTNGPSKLCQALKITKQLDKIDMSNSDEIWLEKGTSVDENDIVTCKRIGLKETTSGDWATKPLRFYIYGNMFVSIKDKLEEKIKEDNFT